MPYSLSKTKYFLLAAIIFLMAVFNCFYKISETNIQNWDEARRGVAAFEMNQNNEYFVHTYRNVIDYWSLKPPVGYWLIAWSFSIFGYSVFALRFFSSLAAIICVLAIMALLYLKNERITSLLAGLILTTTFPFFHVHSARTGDFDSQVALIIVLAVFAHEILDNQLLKFLFLGLMVSLSFLLKGLAVIYIISIFFFYFTCLFFMRKERIKLLNLGVLGLSAFLPILFYFFIRFSKDGLSFFTHMIKADLLRRPFVPIEGHEGGYLFYFEKLINFHWYWLFFIVGLFCLRKNIVFLSLKKHMLYLLWPIVVIIGTSLFQTKASWYLNPIYPGLAIAMAFICKDYINSLKTTQGFRAFLCLLLFVSVIAEGRIVRKVVSEEKDEAQALLISLPPQFSEGKVIHATNWSQANVFIAEVLRKMTCVDNSGIQEFLNLAGEKDLFFGQKGNKGIKKFGNLKIIIENRQYFIATKGNYSSRSKYLKAHPLLPILTEASKT